ncbi:hypothetical protein ACIRYZ_41685 [Kitasatospora sp. NPDC101155]|uniref:hypothetical protein n=1 Tax=Kitasatospora sp. NPDC101155 TaxID=3364097 RepID=UPI00382E9E14
MTIPNIPVATLGTNRELRLTGNERTEAPCEGIYGTRQEPVRHPNDGSRGLIRAWNRWITTRRPGTVRKKS